jgi:hypothetical protein
MAQKHSYILNFDEPFVRSEHIKSFIGKLLLFLLPPALIILISLIIMLVSGELTPLDKVIQKQADGTTPVLYGPAYNDINKYYKLRSLLSRKPDIVIIGTSRVAQFRSKFFIGGVSFYNASMGVEKIVDFRHFLENIPPEKTPSLIIIGLDQDFFNPNWDTMTVHDAKEDLFPHWSLLDIITKYYRQVYVDYIDKKFLLRNLFDRDKKKNRVGLAAIAYDKGVRNDGSYQYGRYLSDPKLNPDIGNSRFKDTIARIECGNRRFEYAREISSGALDELNLILKTCKGRGIYVIGILPPFPHSIYMKLRSMGDKYAYMWKIAPEAKPIFDNYNFGFYDFSDVASVGASDLEIVDGFHESEKACLRLFIEMARTDKTLARYVDTAYLQQKLELSGSNYEVFYNEF